MFAIDGDNANACRLSPRHDDGSSCDQCLLVGEGDVATHGDADEDGLDAGCTNHRCKHEIATLRMGLKQFARGQGALVHACAGREVRMCIRVGNRNRLHRKLTSLSGEGVAVSGSCESSDLESVIASTRKVAHNIEGAGSDRSR